MRNTADLIRELNAEAPKFWITYLVVGFEKTTEFISAADHEGHRKLNDCIRRGGEPVGLMAS